MPPAAPIDPDQQARVAALLAARSAEPHPRTTGRSAAVEGQPGRLKARFASTRRFSELRVIGQFDRTYLVCEDEAELVLIDQHAAHERVMFERVRKGLEQGGLESQLLLMPIALDLPPAAATALCGEREALALLGMEVEPFGGSTVALKSLPIGVSQEKAEQVLRDVASELLGGGDARAVRDVLYELASVMACHSAVRAQDRLAAHEIRALLTDLDQVDFSFACPHGRPFVVRFTLGQIERWFHR